MARSRHRTGAAGVALATLFCAALPTVPAFAQVPNGRAAPGNGALAGTLDFDPLRRFLPRSDLYMQVPGGQLAVADVAALEGAIEQRMRRRHGGFIVGYCLRSSCTRVTHLVALQVCGSRVGGPRGKGKLILGVVKLPYGATPGHLKALQGRDYARNFARHGPYVQHLLDDRAESVSSIYTVSAEAMGPVAALEFLGLAIKQPQARETRALQMTIARDLRTGLRYPRFEVRHLCYWQMS